MPLSPSQFKYRGARALSILHERELHRFVAVWKRARAAQVTLPKTDDPSYASLDHLLRHVLRAARGYMTWTCEKLGLPDPGIPATPEADAIVAAADDYLDGLLDRWWRPLAEVPEENFFQPVFKSRWEVDYCIEAILEHAVVHPMRHALQLEELMAEST